MLTIAVELPIILWTTWVFVVGASVGSMLNVCIARLPLEKSILWPTSSRCGACLQAIRWYDNIPLLSYCWLRGRCRRCGTRFSMRYFLVELFTACAFAGIFYFEIIHNGSGGEFFRRNRGYIVSGAVPWQAWVYLAHRLTLLSFLIVAAACDLQSREIPLSVTTVGTFVGVLCSPFVAWPWPESIARIPSVVRPWWLLGVDTPLPIGVQPWPYWGPLPATAYGSATTGFLTSIIGLLAGTFLLRTVRYLSSRGLGRESLGLGDADLMMMVGAFLGWQVVVVSFFVGALVTLVLALGQLFFFRDDSLPFGPGLALGTMLTTLGWRWVSRDFQSLLFNGELLLIVGGAGGVFLFGLCWLMGRLRSSRANVE